MILATSSYIKAATISKKMIESKGLNIGLFVHTDRCSGREGILTETLTLRDIYLEIFENIKEDLMRRLC